MRHGFLLLFVIAFLFSGKAQVTETANDEVLPYSDTFRPGANLNFFPGWTDLLVADISMGTDQLPGIGMKAFRGSLPEEFLETWGYDIRVDFYQYYESLGADEQLIFVGGASAAHQDEEEYCPGVQSLLFKNMYEPIWDGGANGTPINEENYFATYLWKMVTMYQDYIRFWEVLNEPDFTWNTALSFSPPGTPGNWWDNNPEPCDCALGAPIFHYIRMLRISWEVIKTVDPDAYVCTGGLGNPAFLDAILRNTDNLNGGDVSSEFPLMGGAYFDCLSYHSYPHFDGSMREFNGTGWDLFRNSDRGADGLVDRKNQFEEVLAEHGYDGLQFPKKIWNVSETNIPRVAFGDFIGSDEAQRNYAIKALTQAQKNGIEQVYFFVVADPTQEANAVFEFQTMGLFEYLGDFSYPDHVLHDEAIAYKTASDFFDRHIYDPDLTEELNIGVEVRGGAFIGSDTLFVLWASTSENDQSEMASINYTFPASLNMDSVWYWTWDYSMTGQVFEAEANGLLLSGAPIFIKNKPVSQDTVIIDNVKEIKALASAYILPNPNAGQFEIQLQLDQPTLLSGELLDVHGRRLNLLFSDKQFAKGEQNIPVDIDLRAGIFLVKVFEKEFGGAQVLQLIIR